MNKIGIFLVFLSITIIVNYSYSQTGSAYKSPEDSIECIAKNSTYKEYVIKRYYDEAYPHWQTSLCDCPSSTKNIYLDGVKIYKYLLSKEKNSDRKKALLDSLMFLYDKRIEYFGQEDYVLGLKGIDVLRYDRSMLEDGYGYLEKSVNGQKVKADAAFVITFMQATGGMYKNNKIDAQTVVDNYVNSMDILEKQLASARQKVSTESFLAFKNKIIELNDKYEDLVEAKGKNDHETRTAKKEISSFKKKNRYAYNLNKAEIALNSVEKIFIESGAASCEALVDIFSPQFEANKDDITLLKKLTKILDDSYCTESQLFADASEQLYKLEPSSRAAYNIAKLFVKKEEYDKAIEYYTKAIEMEEDELSKADYYYQLAVIQNVQNQLNNSRTNAAKAISLRPDWGKPYLLIGKIYAASSKTVTSKDNIDGKAVYWIAVDKFKQAKRIDPDVSSEAEKLIQTYKPYYPNKEDAFFFGVTEGQKYTVGNWINETTTARF